MAAPSVLLVYWYIARGSEGLLYQCPPRIPLGYLSSRVSIQKVYRPFLSHRFQRIQALKVYLLATVVCDDGHCECGLSPWLHIDYIPSLESADEAPHHHLSSTLHIQRLGRPPFKETDSYM